MTDFFKQHSLHVLAFAFVMLFVGTYQALFAAPAHFSPDTLVRIAYGSSTPEIAQELADAHILRHPTLLRALLRLTGKSNAIQTGVYKFASSENLFTVAYRLVVGDYGLPPVRITFVEGATVSDMTAQVAQAFPYISAKDFLAVAQPYAGYLFPDTYFFQPGTDAATIVAAMRANFEKKVGALAPEHPLADTVVMASILEKEAKTDADKRLVAGILWNRLRLGMPLQVDAAKETYAHAGLPAVPICNPGLVSLEAAANPASTKYLYYLTGRDGLMHYATTFAEHQSNLRKYLQ